MQLQRMAWKLQRVTLATHLYIHTNFAPRPDRNPDKEGSARLLPELRAVISASQHLPDLTALKWDVWLPAPTGSDWSETHQKYVPHCLMWQDRLLLNASNITVLSLGNVLRPPRLGHLPLQHLELSVEEEEQPWVLDFLSDLRQITSLKLGFP
ncbi:g1648 [Coccomyxa viridis]|uniref:G1648 protein n=1 Tax=Coccomyxa viridis TaxID=1274662 RepID=A0ABP1FNR5_9CHLO